MNTSVVLPFHASFIDGQYQLLPVNANLSSFGSLSTFALMKFCEALSSTQPQGNQKPNRRAQPQVLEHRSNALHCSKFQ